MKIEPLGNWGKRVTFLAKIGTFSSAEIVVKRKRDFNVDDRIEFADTKDLRGMSVGCTPQWQVGRIWKIEGDMLFISRT